MSENPSSWDLPLRRHVFLTLVGVILVAALFRFPGLDYPAEEYFDEVYHAKTAQEYLQGEAPTEWVHPPTAKLLISVGVAAFGYEPWAWRLAPALAGTLLAPVFLAFAWLVTPTRRAALLATALLLLDGVFLVQSRVAMTNVFAVLFQILSALLLLRAATEDRLSVPRMAGAGVALGLALSTRWTSLWAWGFLGIVFLALRARHTLEKSGLPRAAWAREIGLALLTFGVLPAAVYLVSYVPWMMQGHSVVETLELQRDIWNYHSQLDATHNYYSPWWTWPLLSRPTWYFWWSNDEWIRGIVALGNPAIWWASVPAVLWALVSGVKAADPRRVFAGAGFCFLYLPWALSPRTLNFGHYLFEALPYSCLALGMILDRAWDGRVGHGEVHPMVVTILARGYLVVVACLFFLFLPLYTALPLPQVLWAFRFPWGGGLWTWFPSWV